MKIYHRNVRKFPRGIRLKLRIRRRIETCSLQKVERIFLTKIIFSKTESKSDIVRKWILISLKSRSLTSLVLLLHFSLSWINQSFNSSALVILPRCFQVNLFYSVQQYLLNTFYMPGIPENTKMCVGRCGAQEWEVPGEQCWVMEHALIIVRFLKEFIQKERHTNR